MPGRTRSFDVGFPYIPGRMGSFDVHEGAIGASGGGAISQSRSPNRPNPALFDPPRNPPLSKSEGGKKSA